MQQERTRTIGMIVGLSILALGQPSGSSNSESAVGFQGNKKERVSGGSVFGKGVRAYSPQLRRFLAFDGVGYSPMGPGGLNPQAYVDDAPIHRRDRTGHGWESESRFRDPDPVYSAPVEGDNTTVNRHTRNRTMHGGTMLSSNHRNISHASDVGGYVASSEVTDGNLHTNIPLDPVYIDLVDAFPPRESSDDASFISDEKPVVEAAEMIYTTSTKKLTHPNLDGAYTLMNEHLNRFVSYSNKIANMQIDNPGRDIEHFKKSVSKRVAKNIVTREKDMLLDNVITRALKDLF